MFKRSLFIGIACLPLLATGANAQTWDAPTFFSPKPMDDIGLYYFRSSFGSGNVNGLKGIWRQSGNLNLGVQAGVGDISDAGQTILLGAEFYNPLRSMSASTGLLVSWELGAGATFGKNYIDFSVPLGVSIGVNLGGQKGGTGLVPYVHPRASLDVSSFDDPVTKKNLTETRLGLEVDLGADLNLGDKLIIRAGYSLGDRDAFGVGVALRTPRKIIGPAR